MCGICGTVRFDDQQVDPDSLRRGCDALRHRGPDHSGIWIGGEPSPAVGLGAVRLAVMDPSPAGHQPFHDPSGRFHLVFNGEVYNHPSLRHQLSSTGVSFKSDGDTEVVLAACVHWGWKALDRLDGMWALAFYDARERKGFLARDRYGIKPLLYSADARRLDFASEMRGLRALHRVDRTIDSDALIHLLTFGFVADPATIYARVRRLAPGYGLKFGAAGTDEPCEYVVGDTTAVGASPTWNAAEARGRLRRLIGDSVVRQRVADVPTGAFLSGGLDSSIIVHHLAEATCRPLKTFSVGYEGARTYDERPFARLIAAQYATDHHEVVVSDRDALEAIPRVLDHLGEPVGDSSIIPTSLIAQHAAGHVTVALSGDGGDELFGGYWRYLGHEAISTYERLPLFLRRRCIEPLIHALGASKGTRWHNLARQMRKLLRAGDADPITRHVDWCAILAPEAGRVLSDTAHVERCKRLVRAVARTPTGHLDRTDPLNQILDFDLRYQLPSDMLQKVDLAGMMHSLEVRVPLLDHAVVDAVRGLPSKHKVHKGLRKRLLVDAYRGLLPDEVLDRGKQGFEIPIGEYFRGPLRAMFRDLVTRELIGSFDGVLWYDGLMSVLDDHTVRRGEHADLLFTVLSLAWWRRSGG